MMHQQLYLEKTIHRFELKANSHDNAYESAFNLYGVLIIPALIGGILIYNVFGLRQEYFVITFSLMVICLVNIYFFYQRMTYKNNALNLILLNDYIQLIDGEEVYFQEYIQQLELEIILCGKKLEPALSIGSKNLTTIIIGLKNVNINHPIKTKKQLCQPDYWLYNQRQTDLLVDVLCKNNQTSIH